MSSEGSDSESGDEVIKPPTKTKIFVSNLDGFFQKYLLKALVESGTFEVSGSLQDPENKPQGVISAVKKVCLPFSFSSLLRFHKRIFNSLLHIFPTSSIVHLDLIILKGNYLDYPNN